MVQRRVRSLGAVHRSIGNAKGTAGLGLADGTCGRGRSLAILISLILFKPFFFFPFGFFVTVKSKILTPVNYEYGKVSICTVTTYL